jgi:hypothetical protein
VSPEPPTAAKDDLDPELVSLRRRLPISPVLAASVLVFTLILMWRLRADLGYAREPEQPSELPRISATTPLADNTHVSFPGEVDAFWPARLRGFQTTGRRLSPIIGTAGRVWVQESGESIDVTPVYDGRFSGRLRDLDATPFADRLRAHVAEAPPRPRFVFPEALGDGLPALDVHGEPLTVLPDTPVIVTERVAGIALVTMVRTETIPDGAAAREALQALGLDPVSGEQSEASWSFEVAGEPAQVHGRLRAARLFGAAASGKVARHEGRAGELRITAGAVILAGHSVPRAAVEHLQLLLPLELPERSWVLQAGDTPGALWYMPALYAGLAIIALLMVWALLVTARHLRNQRAAHPSH